MKTTIRLSIAVQILWVVICSAQTPIKSREKIEDPSKLSLKISLEKGRFALGESIPVTMTYTNHASLPYELRKINEMGLSRYEGLEFRITKADGGYSDPQKRWINLEDTNDIFPPRDYRIFSVQNWGSLKQGEQKQSCFLNEWFRFEQPGTYTFQLESRLVVEPQPGNRTRTVLLESNPITITLTPPNRELETLVLDKTSAKFKKPENIAAVRFLNTESSRKVLLDWLISDSDLRIHAAMGLVGDREPNAVRDLILETLAKPGLDPPPELLHILGMVVSKEPVRHSGISGTNEPDPAKTPRRTLIGNALGSIRQRTGKQDLDAALVNAVSALGRDASWALEHSWDKLRSKALSPQLAKWATHDRPEYSSLPIDWAGIRWLEIDPVNAREFILSDLKKAPPSLSKRVLGGLPDKEIPELDEILLANLSSSHPRVAFAIERYASKAILADVVAIYQSKKGRWACDTQERLLRYWIKHDRNAGIAATFQAQTYREKRHSRCYVRNLSRVLTPFYDSKIEKRLIIELENEKELDVIYNICSPLLKKGDPLVVDIVIGVFAAIDPTDKSPDPHGSSTRDRLRIRLMYLMHERGLSHEQIKRVRSALVTEEEMEHVLVQPQ